MLFKQEILCYCLSMEIDCYLGHLQAALTDSYCKACLSNVSCLNDWTEHPLDKKKAYYGKIYISSEYIHQQFLSKTNFHSAFNLLNILFYFSMCCILAWVILYLIKEMSPSFSLLLADLFSRASDFH